MWRSTMSLLKVNHMRESGAWLTKAFKRGIPLSRMTLHILVVHAIGSTRGFAVLEATCLHSDHAKLQVKSGLPSTTR